MMISKEEAKKAVKELMDKYEQVKANNKINSYNEEMTKKDFILPLFEALGWNVYNKSNRNDDISAEEKISRKRVDYGFRIDGIPKFFLEAKALKEDLDNIKFVEQAINYAWHKGCTWAILSDFEGIKVFNAEWKSQNPLQNMFFGINCQQFVDRFDQLWLLSKESFSNGQIDKEAEKWGKKAKKIPVDKQLLTDLTTFREILTKNILKKNSTKNLSADELDESVQRILDRLIFIRTLEDKELEPPMLQSLIRGDIHKKIYKKLNDLFRQIDDIYNSKLFVPHLCEDLAVDDNVFEKIIYGLFKTSDNTVHYDFGVIDADVLGNMYEQYLGHILKKTPKRAKLSNGKAHRKEQGIYYTPTYVVDYIVRNTVGELAKDNKFDLKNIKILDPACGSGSFLMKAFDYLVTLDKKKNGDIDQTKLDLTGASATYGKKVEILKDNIFGVDLDPKAVEIAQLNLLLKAAEKKHRLPTLQENIKVGNSLIDNSSVAGKRAFKWEEEFKGIMDNGGFDVVIGNPPYVRVDSLDKKQKEFWKKIFSSAQGKYDLYYLFLEISFEFLKEGGLIGFIVPNKFCAATSATNLRNIIFSNSTNCTIFSVSGLDVFKDARNYPVIIIAEKGKANKKFCMSYVKNQKDFLELKFTTYEITKKQFDIFPSKIFPINISQKEFDIVIRLLAENNRLSDYLQISEGLRIPKEYEKENSSDYEIVKQYQFSKWSQISKGTFIQSSKLKKVVNTSSKRYINSMQEKILIAEDALSISATIDKEKRIPQGGVYFGTLIKDEPLEYLLGLLNSKLLSFIYQILFGGMHMGGGYLRYRSEFLYSLPIKVHKSKLEKDKFCGMINKRLFVTANFEKIGDKQTDEKAHLEKQIQKLDNEIDQEVYKLYGLNKKEIRIIEESIK